jgi:hypothetical protein
MRDEAIETRERTDTGVEAAETDDVQGYLGPAMGLAAGYAVGVAVKLTADYIAEAQKQGEYGYFAKMVKDWWNS